MTYIKYVLSIMILGGSAFVQSTAASLPPARFAQEQISDMNVELEGNWDAGLTKDWLLQAISEGVKGRPTRFADIMEYGYIRNVVFKKSNHLDYKVKYLDVDNAAARFGSGISGYIEYTFEIPDTASAGEVVALLQKQMPEKIIASPARRDEFLNYAYPGRRKCRDALVAKTKIPWWKRLFTN